MYLYGLSRHSLRKYFLMIAGVSCGNSVFLTRKLETILTSGSLLKNPVEIHLYRFHTALKCYFYFIFSSWGVI